MSNEEETTLHTYYYYDVAGLLVTITRVAGSSGRVSVDYSSEDGDPSVILNGDAAATAFVDYTPVSGTLIFDDFEMSKTIRVPILDDLGVPRLNRDFVITLSNPQADPQESGDVSAPRVDPAFGNVVCRILDCDIDPKGPTTALVVTTNTTTQFGLTNTTISTNLAVSLTPTNAVFNFSKSNYRITRDVSDYWPGVKLAVYVNRMGTNTSSVTLHYRFDNEFLNKNSIEDINNEFPLQPASDYAVPFTANPPLAGDIFGPTNFDFQGVGGESGTITFPGGANNNNRYQSQPIYFSLFNNHLPSFNKDIRLTVYAEDSNGNPIQQGMVAETTITILDDDNAPPAGAVDELYNPDFGADMALTNQLGSTTLNPGTEPYSEVYSVLTIPNTNGINQTVIAGAFTTYSDVTGTHLNVNGIARLNADGSLDGSFNQGGSGINVFPGGEFIHQVLLTTNSQYYIGGDFSYYNGKQKNSLARLNSNGSVDNSFNTGAGVNGTVWAMALQPDGKLIIAGDFTTFNSIPAQNLARINTDGSLDSTFSAGTNFNASIYTVSLQADNSIVLGGAFTAVGGLGGQNYIVRLTTSGAIDPSFNAVTGPNGAVRTLAIQPDGGILVGGEFTSVAGQNEGRIVRLLSTGALDSSFSAGIGTDGTVYNINDEVVTNSAGSTNSLIYVGGSFTSFNGTHRLGFARLYPNGTVDTTFLDTAYNQFAGLPRIFYNDPPGTVYSSAVQNDGNVMIAGAFQEVGGGQADKNVRNTLELTRSLEQSFTNIDLWVSDGGTNIEAKTRDGMRIRGNVARLIGGATPGPGNIGFSASSYAVNKTQPSEVIDLIRTNGSLGYATANFSVIPGLASSGSDYSYYGANPTYPIEWEYSGLTRLHTDGLFGGEGAMNDNYGKFTKYGSSGPASIVLGILNNKSVAGNINAGLQLANPVGADQFYLGGENIPLGLALGASVAPLTILDNAHQDGVFGFAASSFISTNSPATVTIVRTNYSNGTVELSYQTVTNGSTAVPYVDYIPTNKQVTFNQGQTSITFPITVLGNSSSAGIEKTVGLQLYNILDLSSGNASLGLTNALLRLINPNFQGFLSLSTNYYTTNVSAGAITFTVNRTVGSKGSLSLQYATADGTGPNAALSTRDYVATNNTLLWNSGDVSSRTVSVPLILNAATVGGTKQFAVNIFNPTLNSSNWPSLLEAPTNAILNITNDNNFGTFQLSASQYRVNDNGGYATITVTRSGSAVGTAQVNYTTVDGTAFAGINYALTTGTLTFAQGQLSSSFNVHINPDTQVEPANFYFNVALTGISSGAFLGSPTNAVVNIIDSLTYNEPPGSIDTSFNQSLIINGSVLALALQSNGKIVAGGIFTSVDGAALNHVARLNTDGSLDSAFMYGLTGADGYVNAVVSQTDDRILLGGAFANVNSSPRGGVARLMTDGTLDTSFVPGSGGDGSVFALAESFNNGSRVLYAGGAFSTFSGTSSPGLVRLNNDGSLDGSFNVGAGANGTVYAVTPYTTNTVYNKGGVLVGGTFTNFNNVSVGNLVRLNANGSVDTSFNVQANSTVRAITIQADGSILIGGDFTAVNGVTANHLARLTNGVSGAVGLDTVFGNNLLTGIGGSVNTIVVQADNRIVVAGQFNQANGLNRNDITRLLPNGSVDPTINFGDGANGAINAVLLQPTNAFLVLGGSFTKFEDQPLQYIARVNGGSVVGSGQFSFSSANYQVDETNGYTTVTVVRSGGSSGTNADGSGNVLVTFSTSNGTGLVNKNYGGVTNVLVFAPGEVFQNITIPVFDDNTVTPNLTVNLNLSNPSVGASLGDQSSAVLTIINDDSGVSFASASYSVPKNTVLGVANISIVRLGSSSGSCSVDFATTTNGSATVGLDYYPTNGTVTFQPGVSVQTVQIPIINNDIPEGQRTVTMLLTNAVNTVLANPTNATLTIIDTVNAPGQVYFATNIFTVVKGNTNVYLTVIRTNGSSGSVAVNYNTVSGTALPGVNYLSSSGTLTLGDGVTSGTIAIPVLDNNLVQGTVNFAVNLSLPANSGGVSLGTQTNATVNIVDHNLGVSFQSATNYTTETSGAALVFVQRVGATNSPFIVSYYTYPITAVPGTNYTQVSNTLSFASGEVLKAVSIPVFYSRAVNGDLFFGINLTNASNGAQLVYPTNALVVIHDSDAGISFTNANTSVLKSAGSVTITVVCSNPSVEPVIVDSNTIPLQVNYSTVNGTGKAGVDYIAQSGTLVFTNGNGTNTFTVPIINNSTLEGNRTFNVVLSNPTAPGQLVAPSTQTVTIIDINSGLQFSSPTYTVLKSGIQATINVLRTGFTSNTVTVNYSATNGTAQANVNFIPVSGTLTFTNGVTNQFFNVPIISSTVPQPDLTVLLQLSGVINAELTYPSFATLTITDPGDSEVIPAGAVLVSEGFSPANGIIDPGETDTLRFAFRVPSISGAGVVTNVSATLIPSSGISQPNGASVSANYGTLIRGGPSVSQPFTLTATGTNGQVVVAAFRMLANATTFTNTFTFYLGNWQTSYSNTAPIIINAEATAGASPVKASPYPSLISVSGVQGVVLKTTVTFTNLSNPRPGGIEALVVAPNQADTVLMNNAGAGNSIQNVTLTFDDFATNYLPQNLPVIVTGTNKPTQYPTINTFP